MFDKNSIYALLTAAFFASLGILAKNIYNYDYMNSYVMLFYSSVFSVIFMFCILMIKYKNFSFLKNINRKGMIMAIFNGGLVALFLTNATSLKSLEYIDAGIQKVLVFSYPIFILAINGILLGKKLEKKDIISILIMMIGLILTIGKIEGSTNVITGIIIALSSSLFNAIYSILEENSKVEISDQLVYWFYAFIAASICSTVFLFFSNDLVNIKYTLNNWILLTLLISCAVFCFTLPYVCFLKSIEKIGAIKTGIILSIAPVLTILLSIIILHERLTVIQTFGTLLIIGSTVFSSLK